MDSNLSLRNADMDFMFYESPTSLGKTAHCWGQNRWWCQPNGPSKQRKLPSQKKVWCVCVCVCVVGTKWILNTYAVPVPHRCFFSFFFLLYRIMHSRVPYVLARRTLIISQGCAIDHMVSRYFYRCWESWSLYCTQVKIVNWCLLFILFMNCLVWGKLLGEYIKHLFNLSSLSVRKAV